jgi:predicted PurR-regulated permease PerM
VSSHAPPPPPDDSIRLSDGTEISLTPVAVQGDEVEVPDRPRSTWSLIVLATIAVLGMLYVGRDIIVPIVFALLLALLLRPLQRRMKHRIPNGISALILVGVVLIVFVSAIWGLAGQAQRWLAQAPQTLRSVKNMLPAGDGPIGDIKETTQAVQDLTKDKGDHDTLQVQLMPANSHDWVYAVLGVSGHFLASAVIVFVLGYFLLALSDQLLKQMVEAMPSFFEKRNVVQLVQNVEQGMSRYLATITVINIGLGIVTALAMWLLRMPNPILWGVMATTLNYVPHVGPFVSMIVLFFVGALEHEALWYGGMVAAVFALITTIESYFITPLMLSRSLELSPLAVILSILAFGWLWGIGGGLLAAPLVAVLKIVCDQFESLKLVGAALGVGSTRRDNLAAVSELVKQPITPGAAKVSPAAIVGSIRTSPSPLP